MDAMIDWMLANWFELTVSILLFFIFCQTSMIPVALRELRARSVVDAEIMTTLERVEGRTQSQLAIARSLLEQIEANQPPKRSDRGHDWRP